MLVYVCKKKDPGPWLKTCNVSGYWPLQLEARKLLAQDRHAEKANGLGRQAEARQSPDACLCWARGHGSRHAMCLDIGGL